MHTTDNAATAPIVDEGAGALNRRLFWELQTINQICEGTARSLELEEVLNVALESLTMAFAADSGSIRLRDDSGGYPERAFVGPPGLRRPWPAGALAGPSDSVIEHHAPCLLDEGPLGASPLPGEGRGWSALSVPMLAGSELIGTLSLGSATPGRFRAEDERFLGIVASQVLMAVQNARLHEVVRRGKTEWERTFDAISDPIAVFDSRGALLRGNAALAQHLGRDVRGLRGAVCDHIGFCGGTDAECDVLRAVIHGASRAERTQADGQIFSVTTFPIAGGAEGASVVQVAKNVTEDIRSARRLRQLSEELSLANARSLAALERLKATQAQLLQAEKLSAIGQLVAGVAHELNNPLTSVIGYAQLLEEEMRESELPSMLRPLPELAHDLRRIAEESERAARIVRNLLAFARRQTASRAPQDVVDLFGRVLALRAYEHRLNNIEVVTEFDPALASVVADGSQIQQALLNLVLNAEHAMRGRPLRRLRAGARYNGPAAAVELYLADTGHGIDEITLSRIFDPFFTTREVGEGTGLGLSICYGIIRDHGGQIAVESTPDVGTTVSMFLPARVEDGRDPILVAHTDHSERDFVTAALSAWGCDALPAASSVEALEICRTRPLRAAFVDRSILAADLPGWRAARAAGNDVPLVLMSMAADDGDVERFGRQEARAAITPPFQLWAIRAAVRAVSRECV